MFPLMIRLFAIAALLFNTLTAPLAARGILRDADIEHGLNVLADPILRAAGLSPSRVKIRLVDDNSLNAFVIDGSAIFIHSGLINRLGSAGELQAVIAHEAAHIANGHATRRIRNAGNAQRNAMAGLALAVAAAVSGNGEASLGLAAGAQGAAMRNFLSHTRAEESAADQSSIEYMRRAGIDPRGAARVLEIFKGQEALSRGRQDPYVLSHPLTRDRLRAVEARAHSVPEQADSQTMAYWFARVKGKLSAFQHSPRQTLRRVRSSDDTISAMRRAIAYHRRPEPAKAIREMGALMQRQPNDPYLWELYGQILLENRKTPEAAQAYANAVRLAPNNAQILAGHGRALLALGNAGEAVRVMERARARDAQDPRLMRDLAQAYAQTGQNAMAALATAERYMMSGRLDDAERMAQRAAGALPNGSASWQRAEDVLAAVQSLKGR